MHRECHCLGLRVDANGVGYGEDSTLLRVQGNLSFLFYFHTTYVWYGIQEYLSCVWVQIPCIYAKDGEKKETYLVYTCQNRLDAMSSHTQCGRVLEYE